MVIQKVNVNKTSISNFYRLKILAVIFWKLCQCPSWNWMKGWLFYFQKHKFFCQIHLFIFFCRNKNRISISKSLILPKLIRSPIFPFKNHNNHDMSKLLSIVWILEKCPTDFIRSWKLIRNSGTHQIYFLNHLFDADLLWRSSSIINLEVFL
jgi:hypothetical protein